MEYIFLFMIAFLGATILGCGFSFMVVGLMLKASNKMGDSKGDFYNFAGSPMRFITRKNL